MYFLPDWYIKAKENNTPDSDIRDMLADIMQSQKADNSNADPQWVDNMVGTYETMYDSYRRCHWFFRSSAAKAGAPQRRVLND